MDIYWCSFTTFSSRTINTMSYLRLYFIRTMSIMFTSLLQALLHERHMSFLHWIISLCLTIYILINITHLFVSYIQLLFFINSFIHILLKFYSKSLHNLSLYLLFNLFFNELFSRYFMNIY